MNLRPRSHNSISLIARTLFFLLASAGALPAAQADRPTIAVPFSAVEPSLEAASDDAVWRSAATINGLTSPLGAPAAERPASGNSTRISLLWTESNLWIRFQCTAPTIVRLPQESTPPPRDLFYYKADCVEVFLDPVGDGRAFVELELSPDGGVFDAMHLYSAPIESDSQLVIKSDIIAREAWFLKEWNLSGLQSTARINPPGSSIPGWSVTLAIPAKGLQRLVDKKFSPGMTLRANFIRFDYKGLASNKPEITNWAPVPEGRAHRAPAGMGSLHLQAADHTPSAP